MKVTAQREAGKLRTKIAIPSNSLHLARPTI